jgi:hypothetical protein
LKNGKKVARAMRGHSFSAVATTVLMVLAAFSPGIGLAVGEAAQLGSSGLAAPNAATLVGSYNWAGYAATGANLTVTLSAGTWVQPTVNCANGKSAYLADWVGIDGFANSDLVQTGTGASCIGGVASYNAWWEVLPAPETPIGSITVHAGDTFSASVTYTASSGKFTMKITDTTTGATFSKKKTVSGTERASAECIVERPEVGGSLAAQAKYKTDKFTSCSATVAGVHGDIGTFASLYQINMYNNAATKVIGLTSALTSSKSFKVTWKGYD